MEKDLISSSSLPTYTPSSDAVIGQKLNQVIWGRSGNETPISLQSVSRYLNNDTPQIQESGTLGLNAADTLTTPNSVDRGSGANSIGAANAGQFAVTYDSQGSQIFSLQSDTSANGGISNTNANNLGNLLSSLSFAIYNPGSDVAFGSNPNQIIAERTGNGILIGYQPVPAFDNPNAPKPQIDFLAGDITIEDSRRWNNTFVLGNWEAPYYANNGLEDLGVIIDFNPARDTIQLYGNANDYQLLNTGLGTAIVYQTPTGGDPIGFVLGNSLSLNADYFQFRGTTPPPGPVIPQAKQVGTLGFDVALGVATDGNGNVYVGGTTAGAITGNNFGLLDGFVVKYDSQGNELFRRQIGSNASDQLFGVATDNQGNFYVSGLTEGALGGPLQSEQVDAFVAKYDSSGNQQWIRQVGQNVLFPTFTLAVDANNGDVFITGPDVRSSLENPDDAFTIKFDTNGNEVWRAPEIGTSGFINFDETYGITVGKDNSVYVTGWTNGNLAATNQGLYDNWLARLNNTTGEVEWVRQYGTPDYEWSWSVATDSQNNVYTTGWTLGSLGGQNAGSYDAYLTKFDNQGNLQWIKQFGTSQDDEARDLFIDASDNIFITGFTLGDLGGTNAGSFDTWVARFDTNGNQQWITQFGTPDRDDVISITADNKGSVYVVGDTQGSLGSLNAGSFDAWTAKLDAATGSLQNFNGTPENPLPDEPQIFNGNASDDVVRAGNGNNIIYANDGNNRISAGNGDNQVYAGSGNDLVDTGNGNNVIYVNDGDNTVKAGNGNNSIYAGSGNDVITTGAGNDLIYANDGNNTINAGSGNNTIYVGLGNDVITTGIGDDLIYAGDGNNTINAGSGNNSVYAGSGNDVITTGIGDDLIYAGDGNNTINAGSGDNTVYAGLGNDVISTGAGDDLIYAGEGNNTINAGSGNNTVYAGSGNDVISAGAGDDSIYAGEGNNTINAGSGNNTVYAGLGNDVITTGIGDDLINAGDGNNTINAGSGNNTVYAGSGNNVITTGIGDDLIYAGDGNNTINAGSGNNTVYAGSGNDVITTGIGDDLIYAGDGNNTINAGIGNDTVYVGNGVNRFILNAGIGAVTIYGFTSNDSFSLGSSIFDRKNLTFTISGNDTLINAGDDLLATLKWTQLNTINLV